MVSSELKAIVESVIFASEEEIGSRQIKEIIDSSGLRISVAEIEETVKDLNDEYRKEGRAFEIMSVAGGFSYATRKDYSRFVGKLYEEKQRKKLSQSAIETLSIIAYKQPITRNEIEFVRGVNVDYIVNSLLERDLITIHGRADSPGRPILYGTTKNFLKVLGLNSLEDLPKLKEINEILKSEEIEGITEADIELFNSVSSGGQSSSESEDHQLTLITGEEQTIRDDESNPDAEGEASEEETETGAENYAQGNNEIIKQEGSFEEGVREEERQDTDGQQGREDEPQ